MKWLLLVAVVCVGCGEVSPVAPSPAVRVKVTPTEFVGPEHWVPPCLVACGGI